MRFKDFLRSLDPVLTYFLSYRLKKFGFELDSLEEDQALEIIAKATGSHIAEVLYTMYLQESSKLERAVIAEL